ncbi:MAG: NAD(P)/FAD-dependent oxidoreductase [Rhizobacter sp.]|nr:NAD(P)/FAD-dependent oxidoreductase [Burkholderiales bacterium]
MPTEHFDVLIIGAGLSGVGAARHLQMHCPDRSYAILEGRSSIGGTWDLFRYPGIRSDSDMYTLGYSFKPWEERKAIADGPSILKYVRDTAHENDIERHVRFGHTATRAAWSTADARWTLEVERGDAKERVSITCNFLFMCSGYYRYDKGFTPDFAGVETFAGRVVHPQQWTDDVTYAGKRVVVIGSGATAVTLVPELAKQAAHVTMLQRSPTYIVARPSEDALANKLRRWLPAKLAYSLTRWKRVLLGIYIFQRCRREPEKIKRMIVGGARMALGPDFDVAKHFTPRYNPWDQRLCLAPDGDFFASIRSGRASVATDEIERFTETGIQLKSGAHLEADVIVTATGLNLQVLGGLQLMVDGVPVDLAKTMNYKGLMYSGVPNLASSSGYTNASWTLKCDLTCEYVCRLLNYMKKRGIKQCTPYNTDPSITEQPWVSFSSSYFARAMHLFPKQGSKAPWKLYQNYPKDIMLLRYGKLDDGALKFA